MTATQTFVNFSNVTLLDNAVIFVIGVLNIALIVLFIYAIYRVLRYISQREKGDNTRK